MPWERGGVLVGGALPSDQGYYPWELEAMAQADARRADPRALIDTPQAIQAELLSPLGIQFSPQGGYSRGTPTPQSRPQIEYEKAGSTLLKRDPFTGELSVAYQPESDLEDKWALANLDRIRRDRERLSRMSAADRLMLGGDYDTQIKALEADEMRILKGRQPASSPEPITRRSSFGFMGDVGGENLFENPFDRGVRVVSGGSSSVAKTLTRDIAADFLKRAGGDKNKAREMARQSGYSL